MDTGAKNILFITNLHLWSLDKGKGGAAFYNTVLGYKRHGWNIWIVSTGGGIPDGLVDVDRKFEEVYPRLDRLWRNKNRMVSILARFFRLLLINLFYLRKGSQILRGSKRMIIYAYEVDSVYSAKKLSKWFKVPFVTRFQGTKHADTSDSWISKIRKAPHLTAMATASDLCIMTNDGTKGLRALERFGNRSRKVLFWRNGVSKVAQEMFSDREKFRREFGFSDFFVFLCVSRLVNWKRVERSIVALARISEDFPRSKLVIVGDGEAKVELVELVRELGIENRVEFVGAVAQDQVSKYMIAADVFLSFYDLSNVGNPLMEAMMCGKPILTLDVGDTGELIVNGKNGILLSPDKLDDIPIYMANIIRDTQLFERLSKGAFESARTEFWSWEERIDAEVKEVGSLVI